jgi:TRAP-type C4-dicarboxylate transport system substrate-binding protein
MDRRRASQLALAVLLLALTSGGAKAADQKMVFKASDVHPAGYPTVQAVENMG